MPVVVLTPDDWHRWREPRLAALAALAEAPAAFGSTLPQWTGDADTEDRWRARLSSVPFNAIITCDEFPAGMVGATVTEDGAVELLSMWVLPEFRGRCRGRRGQGRHRLGPGK